MSRILSRAAVVLPAALLACARAQDTQVQSFPAPPSDPTTPAITVADLKQRLYLIADDSMGGRNTGSVGHYKTVLYLAAELKRLGVQPAGDNGTFLQKVPFVRRTRGAADFSVGGEALRVGDDFVVPIPNVGWHPINDAQVVYGGVLTDSMTWITSEQAAGKFVILSMAPNDTRLFGGFGSSPRWKQSVGVGLTGYGALWPNLVRFFPAQSGPQLKRDAAPGAPVPASIYVSLAAAEKLLGAPVASATPGTIGKSVTGRFEFSEAPLDAYNVVGIVPGSDARLKNTYVAIGAHSDHVGEGGRPIDHDSLHIFAAAMRKARIEKRQLSAEERAALMQQLDSIRKIRPPRGDTIRNGADDDASGTVGVLEIAEAMAKASTKPKRSVLFIWHVGEELGMLGSEHYTDHPSVPRDSIVAQLNVDMIGRGGVDEEPGGGPDYVQLIGWRRLSNELGDVIDTVNRERKMPFKFDLTYDAAGHPEQYYCRSDHYSYARYNIPISFFSTGSHGDYHQVTDEPQYIDYTKLMNVSQLIHDVGLRLASMDHRPKVDGPKNDPKGTCRQ